MTINKVLVIFKTHLDIGFTDFSANVIEKYMTEYLPNAARVAGELEVSGSDARLVWSTGSWLIAEYLRTHNGPDAEPVRKAIAEGKIRWHGLPFTTHTELMSRSLFEYALSISKNLDKTYGRSTIAAKMTDVPGHTKAIIPMMKKAGLEFLHIGVNPASTVPGVPPLFRWQADNGDMINVMYQFDYGEFAEIPGTGTAVCFAHTGDNLGVQSAESIVELFEDLHNKLPDAEIIAADLNDLAMEVRKIENTLPVITDEIGDTWIHGAGTDPKKVSGFRALERLMNELPDGDDRDCLARNLIMIPEHTWGLDEKTHLHENANYSRAEFGIARKNDNYLKMEASWREQRAYLTAAVEGLSAPVKEKALALLAESERLPANTSGMEKIPAGEMTTLGNFTLRFNRQGEIDFLEMNGRTIADRHHPLCTLCYEQFAEDDFKRFYNQYIRADLDWSFQDFTKPNVHTGVDSYHRYAPSASETYRDDEKIIVTYMFPLQARREFGCPTRFDMILTAEDNALHIDLAWFNKPANRMGEALWLGFRPIAEDKRISKLGTPIDPTRVVRNGQRRLHATDFGVLYNNMTIETKDAALVAPQEPSLLNFINALPDDADPVFFNLYNNIWGTNFPMWYEDNARFNFILTAE